MQAKNIAIAAGGTAGHINPALAFAEELRERGHHICFYGQQTRLEAKLVPQAQFDFFPCEVTGFDRSRPWTLVTSWLRIKKAQKKLTAHFNEVGWPDLACGFGAYVELPLLMACRAHNVPYILHDQNSVVGLANKLMAKGAARACISLPQAKKAFETKLADEKIVLTGNPVRSSILHAHPERVYEAYDIPRDAFVLLIFGGSLGAEKINLAFAKHKKRLLAQDNLYVIHATGQRDFEQTQKALHLSSEEQKRYKLVPYIDAMGDMLHACSLVVSRSGASSVAEIAAVGKPSILIPFPKATENHQEINAQFLVQAHAADLYHDEELEQDEFIEHLLNLITHPDTLNSMAQSARDLGQARAAVALAEVAESVLS